MAVIAPTTKQQFFDANGDPLSGGFLHTTKNLTDTDKITWKEDNETNPNENPIELNSRGECDLHLVPGEAYRLRLEDSLGSLIWQKDNVIGSGSGSIDVANIADLKSTSPSGLSLAHVLGYYTEGDGGGELWYWNSTSTTSENKVTIVELNSAPSVGRWERVSSEVITFKQAGAKGNGSFDDTDFINSANTWVNANNKTLVATSGNYLITSSVAFGSATNLRMEKGASFSAGSSLNVTFNGIFEGTVDLHFGTNITAIFGSNSIEYGLSEWWGPNTTPGTTDMATNINKAITACPEVRLLGDIYGLGSFLSLKSNFTLYGSGMNSTTLKELNDFTADTTGGKMIYGDTVSFATVRDLYVKGQMTSFVTADRDRYGIFLHTCANVSVLRCKVSNIERGIFFYHACTDGRIEGCFAEDCYYAAYGSFGKTEVIDPPSDKIPVLRTTMINNQAINCVDTSSDKSYPPGCRFEETYNSIISNNTISGCGQGIRVENSNENVISNNTCFENQRTGIQIYKHSKRNTIIGNVVRDNNTNLLTDLASIETFSISAAGTGYAVGNILTLELPGVTGEVAAMLKVTSVGGSGEITGIGFDAKEGEYPKNNRVNRGWKYSTGVTAVAFAKDSSGVDSSGSGCTINITAISNSITATTPEGAGTISKSHSGIQLMYDCQNNVVTGNTCYNSTTGNGNQKFGVVINNQNYADVTETSNYNTISNNICVNNDDLNISDRGFYNKILNNIKTLGNE